MSYNLSSLAAYTDQMSFDAISNAVLQTNLMEYATLRAGLKAGTTAVNILDADIAIGTRTCDWTPDGSISFTQVDLVMNEYQTKQSLCPTLLREVYLAEKISATAHAEEVPFEEVVFNLWIEKIKNANEAQLATDLIAAVVAGGTSTSQASASTSLTILDDVYALYDAIDPAYMGREDLAVMMSPAMFNLLRRALVAQNLFHAAPSDNNNELVIPGTDIKAVKGTFSGATMIAGPMKDVIIGVGLEGDDENLKIFYSQDNDQVRVMAAWRLGLAVVNAAAWSYNGL